MSDMGNETPAGLRECLEESGIPQSDCRSLIEALFLAAPTREEARRLRRFDAQGHPLSMASVTRTFGPVSVTVEDHVATYTVLVTRTDAEGRTENVVGFFEVPWGEA